MMKFTSFRGLDVMGHRLRRFLVSWLILMLALPVSVWANPSGEQVVSGSATFNRAGTNLAISQGSDKAIIDWQSFSIGAGEATNFLQPSAMSAVLNRVISGDPSQIYGNLTANGQVFLVNQNGILVGASGVIDTNGFVASTLDVTNGAFLNGGDLTFLGASESAVINLGKIDAVGGDVLLIARDVQNSGEITASEGTVALAAGSEVLVKASGNERVFIQAGSSDGKVENSGLIDSASAELKALGGNEFALAINNEGAVRATGVEERGGRIWLVADQGTVENSGSLTATQGEKGGEVQVLGDRVALTDNAVVDVSGDQGGGIALIGGDFQGSNVEVKNAAKTFIGADTQINADALVAGDGGKVIVWSDETTQFYGDISAKGGTVAGDGGFVEVSGKESLVFRGSVDASAVNGTAGQLLLDPKNITVADGGGYAVGVGVTFSDGGDANDITIDPAAIETIIDGGTNVSLQANNDITIADAIVSSGTGIMTFEAGRSITIDGTIQTNNSNINFYFNDTDADTGNRVAGVAAFINNALINAGTADVVISADDTATDYAVNVSTGIIMANNLSITHNQVTQGGLITLEGVTLSGALTVDALTGNVNIVNTTADGAIRVAGTTQLKTDGDVDIQGASTDFEILGVTANDVTIFDKKALELGASGMTSTISGDLKLDIVGPIGNQGVVNVTGAAYIKTTDGGFGIDESNINLSTYDNNFSTLIVDQDSSGSSAAFRDADDIVIGGTFGNNLTITTVAGSMRDFTVAEIAAMSDVLFDSTHTIDAETDTTVAPITFLGSNYTNLNAGATGSIDFDHANTDFDRLWVNNALNVVINDIDDIRLYASDVQGSYDLDAGGNIIIDISDTITVDNGLNLHNAAGSISMQDSSKLTVAGSLTITSDASTVSTGTNADIAVSTGDLTITAASSVTTGQNSDITVSAGNTIVTAGSTIATGYLSDVTVGGDLTITAASSVTTGQDSDITVNAGNTIINAGSTVATGYDSDVTVGGDLTIDAASTVSFGEDSNIDVNAGSDLSITAGGTISQHRGTYDDGTVTVEGASTFTVTAADSDLLLSENGNTFAGTVTMNSSVSGTYRDVNFRNADAANAVLSGLESTGTLRNVTLYFDNAPSLELPGMDLTGNLTVNVNNGGLTQANAILVDGYSTLYVDSQEDITLDNIANDFYRLEVDSANDVTITDANALDLYNDIQLYDNGADTGDLTITTGGNLTDTTTSYSIYYIDVDGGLTTFDVDGDIVFDGSGGNSWSRYKQLQIVAANNVNIDMLSNVELLTSNITGTFELDDNGGHIITQVGGSTLITGGNTTFRDFSDITLSESGNDFGALYVYTPYGGTTDIQENADITQWSNWYAPSQNVYLTVTDDQAITMSNIGNYFGNLRITQETAVPGGTVGAVHIAENYYMTQNGAWTTHGDTYIQTSGDDVSLTYSDNVLGALKVVADDVTIYENDTIEDYDAWTTDRTTLNAYDLGVSGDGNVDLDHANNVMGNLTVTAQDVTIVENGSITDNSAWNTPGTVVLNPGDSGSYDVSLDNISNILGGIDIDGTPSSVTIYEDHNITQSGAWNIGSASVNLNATNDNIALTESGNVLGDIKIYTSNGTPSSISIKEDDAITQNDPWIVIGTPVTLTTENEQAITLTDYTSTYNWDSSTWEYNYSILGDLTLTGGAVTITENNDITDGGAWTTTGITTLNPGTTGATSIVLNNVANVIGDIAIAGDPQSLTIYEDHSVTQASAWNLADDVVTLIVTDDNDIILSQALNLFGNLNLTAGGTGNVTVTENGVMDDGTAWTVGGTATLNSGTNNMDLDADSSFGTLHIVATADADIEADIDTVQIDSADNVILVDPDAIDFNTSAVTSLLSVSAGGEITQTGGAITAANLLLTGTGYATLNNVANDVEQLAAGFSGGDLQFTDSDDFAISTIGGTVGIGIGVNDVTLVSVADTLTGISDISNLSSSLTITTGTGLELPSMFIGGSQDYTAGGTGIALTASVQSTSAGAITFHSPVTTGSDLTIQSTNSNIVFNDTLAGATNRLEINAGTGTIAFDAAVSGVGSSEDALTALNLTAGGTGSLFNSTLQANNGITVTGPVTFRDDVTLGDGTAGSVFAGLVTLSKVGGMDLIGYDTLRFSGGVVLENGDALINSNNSLLTFEGVNTISGPFGLTLNSGTSEIMGLDHVASNLTSLDVTADEVTIPGVGISIAGAQTYTSTGGTDITLDGNVTGTATGVITFNNPVTMGASATVTSFDSIINFESTLDGPHDLTVNSGTAITNFKGAIGSISALGDRTGASLTLNNDGITNFDSTVVTQSGILSTGTGAVIFDNDVTLGDGDTGSVFNGMVTTGGTTLSGYDGIAFTGGLTLTGEESIVSNGSVISFGDTVSGPHGLILNTFADSVGTVTGLNWIGSASDLTQLVILAQTLSLPSTGLAVAGPMYFAAGGGITLNGTVGNSANPATGRIVFNGPVSLATGVVNVTTKDADVTFAGEVDGAQALTVNAGTGLTTFTGAVGESAALTSLTTDAGGTTAINGGLVQTTGAQTYNDAVTLGADARLIATGVSFASTLDGSSTLFVNGGSGITLFGGAVGGNNALTSLTTYQNGSTVISGGSIHTSAEQYYGDAVNLGADTVLTGENISFVNTLNGPHDLTVNGSGVNYFFQAVGGNNALTSLTTDAAGTTTIYGGAISTSGGQFYNERLNLGADTTLSGDEIDFNNSVIGDEVALTLQPSTNTVDVIVGGDDNSTDALDLTAAELDWLPATLSNLTIGRIDGSGTLAIAGATDLSAAPLTLNGIGGISQSAELTADTLSLFSNGAIDLSNSGNVLGDIAMSGTPTSVAISDSTEITQNGTWVLGTANTTLDAGSNAITLTETNNTFGTLALTGGAVEVVENAATDLGTSGTIGSLKVTSTGAITTSGTVTVTNAAEFKTTNDAAADITIANNSTFGTLSATTRNTADATTVAGHISIAPGTSTQLAVIQTTGDVTLTAASGETLSQTDTSILNAAGLELLGSGSHDLSSASNAITTLAGNAGAVILAETDGFSIGTVNTVGLNTSGDTVLSSDGDMTQSQKIVADGLLLSGTGSVTFLNYDNDVNSLAAILGDNDLIFTDNNGLEIGTVAGVAGIALGSGDLTLDEDSGNVTQSAAFQVAGLSLKGQDASFTLDHPDNDVTTLSGSLLSDDGSIELCFRDDNGFDIGTVAGRIGLSLDGHSGSVITLISSGMVTQSQLLNNYSNGGLALLGANGRFVLDSVENDTSSFAANTGSVRLWNQTSVHVGSVDTGSGTLTGVTTSGDLSFKVGTSNGAYAVITQDADAPLIVGGDLTLETTYNRGDVSLNNTGAEATIIGDSLIGGALLLTATSDAVTQAADTNLKVAGDLSIVGDSILLDGDGNLIQGNTSLSGSSSIVEIRESGVIILDSKDIVGNLTVVSEASSKSFDDVAINGDAIVLNNAANAVTGSISITTVAPTITEGDDVQTGINQADGSSLKISGVASFTAEDSSVADSGIINLSNEGNEFGSVALNGSTVTVKEDSGATQIDSASISGTFTLNSAGAVTQAGAVEAGTLSIEAGGAVNLDRADNDVDSLNVIAAGNVVFADADGLDITGVNVISANVALTSGGDITQSGALAGVDTLFVAADGSITLDATDNEISTLRTVTAGTGIAIVDSAADLTLDGDIASAVGDVMIRADGGNLTLDDGSTITVAGDGDIYLVAGVDHNFINNDSTPDTGALVLDSGRFIIYSDNNDDTTEGGLNGSAYMGRNYASNNPTWADAFDATGNHFYYNDQATLTFTAGDKVKTYGDASPTLTYVVTGLLSGDTETDAFTGDPTLATVATLTSDVGDYAVTIENGGLTNEKGYLFEFVDGLLTIETLAIEISAAAQSKTYGDADPGLTYSADLALIGTDSFTGALSRAVGENVGNYAIEQNSLAITDGNGGANYALSFVAGNLAVTPAALIVSANSDSKTYDSLAYSGGNGVGYSGFVNSEDRSVLGGTLSYAGSAQGAVNAGGYLITPQGLTAGNYDITFVDGSLIVNQANLVLTTSDVTRTYNGTLAAAGTTLVEAASGTALYGTDSLSGGSFAFTDANAGIGNKTVTVDSVTVNDGNSGLNYDVTYANNTSSTINKAALTISSSDVTKTYDGNVSAAGHVVVTSGTLYNNASNGGTQDSLSGGSFAFDNANASSGDKVVTVDSVTVIDGNSGDNYAVTYADNTSSTINPYAVDLTGSRGYDGTADVASGIFTLGTLVGTETLTLSGSGTLASKNVVADGAVSLGTLALVDGTGLASNYTFSGGRQTASIGQATLTISSSDVTKTYDGRLAAAGTATTTDTLYDTDSLSGGSFAYTDANYGEGSKTVTVAGVSVNDGNSGNNYAISYAANTSSTINKAAITISTSDVEKTYDGTLAATGSAIVTSGTLYNNASNGGMLDSISGGSFAFTDANVGIGSKAVTVDAATVSDGNSGENYTVIYADNTSSTINRADISIASTDVIKIYDTTVGAAGNAEIVAGTLYTNASNGGALDTISGGTFAFADANAATNKTVSTSSVTVADGNAGGNYNLTYVDNTTSTINQAPLAITANDDVKTYDAAAYSGGNGVTFSAFAGTEDETVLNGMLSYAGSSQGAVGVGSYVIIPQGKTSQNYDITFTAGELVVDRAILTYVANATNREYGENNPLLNGYVEGFVTGDSVGDLDGSISWTTPAAVDSDSGSYAINGSGYVSANYDFNQAAGNATAFTIDQATLTYEADANTIKYGDANPALTGNVTGFKLGQDVGVLGGAVEWIPTSTASSDVGIYGVDGAGYTSANYNFVQAAGNVNALTVEAATLTYTANAIVREYGDANPNLGGTITGLKNGELLSDVTSGENLWMSNAASTSNVGFYPIYGIGLTVTDSNYNVVIDQAIANETAFSVTPAVLQYAADAVSRQYGNENPTLTGIISGFKNGESVADLVGSVSWTTPATLNSELGSYAINGSGLSSLNYTIGQDTDNATALTILATTISAGGVEVPIVNEGGVWQVVNQGDNLVLIDSRNSSFVGVDETVLNFLDSQMAFPQRSLLQQLPAFNIEFKQSADFSFGDVISSATGFADEVGVIEVGFGAYMVGEKREKQYWRADYLD